MLSVHKLYDERTSSEKRGRTKQTKREEGDKSK